MKRTIFSAMALLLASAAGCGSTTSTPSLCATVTCSASQFCDAATGACKTASVCAGVTCGAGTVCDGNSAAGTCVVESCGLVTCTMGQVCNNATATCVNPGVPALGVQIDRMGRPAVNTALTNPFDVYTPVAGQGTETSDTTKARYNSDANPSGVGLATTWAPAIAQHLAILDGLDATCFNQLAYNVTIGGVVQPTYSFLSSVLAGDALLVDSSKPSCTQYLGVEAAALGVAGVPANECGGRQLGYDVIDRTYSVLAAGALAGVSDGIAQPATNVPTATFPFFAPPI